MLINNKILKQFYEAVTIIIHILQIRKLRD